MFGSTPIQFQRARKSKAKLRLALIGPSGSGKTFTALAIASGLGGRVAVIDTEHGSTSKYADRFDFDVLELDEFHPRRYVEAIRAAEAEGYGTVIIDSLSHAWVGRGGALELVDKATQRNPSRNTFTAWKDVTPLHNELIDAIVRCKCHVIGTMRAKQEYVLQPNAKGQMEPVKVGLGPVQRDGMEYEFDVAADLTLDHRLIVTKTRCQALDGAVIEQPGRQVAEALLRWLSDVPPAGDGASASPPPKAFRARKPTTSLRDLIDRALNRWNTFDPITDEVDRAAREQQLIGGVVTRAAAEGLLDEATLLRPARPGQKPRRDPAKCWAKVRELLDADRAWFLDAVKHDLDQRQHAEPRSSDKDDSAGPEANVDTTAPALAS